MPWIAPMFERPAPDRRLTPAERAAIDRGIADIEAGRFGTLEEVEAEMEH